MNFTPPSNLTNKSIFDPVNTNKFFIGLMMILLNIGSKYITIQTSKSMEEYMKLTISKQVKYLKAKNKTKHYDYQKKFI